MFLTEVNTAISSVASNKNTGTGLKDTSNVMLRVYKRF